MSFTSGPVFTSAGEKLLARAIAGETLTFTAIQLGDGDRGTAAIRSMTALVHPVASVGIASLRHHESQAIVGGMFSNADIATGFYWREVGLLAADPDHPDDRTKDILYCYQSAANPEYISASDSELITKRLQIAAIVGSAATVTATFAPNISADDVTFDNSETDLEAETVQEAIEELRNNGGGYFSFTEEPTTRRIGTLYGKIIGKNRGVN